VERFLRALLYSFFENWLFRNKRTEKQEEDGIMNPVARILISLGVFLIVLGIFWQFGSKTIPLGRLPGDIVIEKENFKFYFPVVTSILLSVIFSLILILIRFFRG